jgi:hypothetical protein
VVTSNQARLLAVLGAMMVLLLAALAGVLLLRAREAATAPVVEQAGYSPAPGNGPTMTNTPIASPTPTATPTQATIPAVPTDSPPEATPSAPESGSLTPTATPSPTTTPALEATPLPPAVVLTASGQGDGVTPEVDLPPGVYRVVFQTVAAGGTITPEVIEGVCSATPLFSGTTAPEEGTTYRSTGCRVRFGVAGAGGEWTLTVETATRGGLLTPPAAFSGDGPMTTGLIDLPAGNYRIAFSTDSPYSMVTPIVVSGPCLERPILMLTGPGQFEATYSSGGCQVVFQVSSVTAHWELNVMRNE